MRTAQIVVQVASDANVDDVAESLAASPDRLQWPFIAIKSVTIVEEV